MGYKTIKSRNEVEKRTHVKGEFMGKYFGYLSLQNPSSKFECYDIHIYQGEISNLKNEKEHPEIINESIYNAIESETQLTLKSFENILVNLDYTIDDFNSVRLAIKEPKLQVVQIYDVVKDTDQTFGTLTCLVSGYLLEAQVETCKRCGEFPDECNCDELVLNIKDAETIGINIEKEKETFWKRHFGVSRETINWNWGSFTPFSFGCLGTLGLLAGILILISFGLPGILIGGIILLVCLLSSLTNIFPSLRQGWRKLIYFFLGLLLLTLSFNLFNTFNKNQPLFNNPQVVTTPSENQQIETTSGGQESNLSNSNSENEIVGQSNGKSILREANITDEEIDFSPDAEQSNTQNQSEVISGTNESETLFEETPTKTPQESDEDRNTETAVEILANKIEANQELVGAQGSGQELQSEDFNGSNQISNDTPLQAIQRQKQSKATEIVSGIVFQEGEVFICKGEGSERYHLDPSCSGLSNCATPIYKINIPAAERLGRTLCQIEE